MTVGNIKKSQGGGLCDFLIIWYVSEYRLK